MRATLSILAVVLVVGCRGKPEPPPPASPPAPVVAPEPEPEPVTEPRPFDVIHVQESKSPDAPANQLEIVRAAVQLLYLKCAPLHKCWMDVQYGEAIIGRELNLSHWYKTFKWGDVVEVDIELMPKAACAEIPAAKALGHTLHYKVGAGKKPGIYGFKPQCQAMCDLDPTTGWKSVPGAADIGLSNNPTKL